MQKYMQRTKFSEKIDRLGLYVLYLFLCQTFFIRLWGFFLPSMIAGGALFSFFLLFHQRKNQKKAFRRFKKESIQAGGEIMLQKMMKLSAKEACEKMFSYLFPEYQWEKIRLIPPGILFRQNDRTKWFIFLQQHSSEMLYPSFIWRLQRMARTYQADEIILCTPAQISPEIAQDEKSFPIITHLDEKTLTNRLGTLFPASKEKLCFHRPSPSSPKWYEKALQPQHLRLYGKYAILLMLLYFLTRIPSYAVFSCFLMLLMVLSRIFSIRQKKRLS